MVDRLDPGDRYPPAVSLMNRAATANRSRPVRLFVAVLVAFLAVASLHPATASAAPVQDPEPETTAVDVVGPVVEDAPVNDPNAADDRVQLVIFALLGLAGLVLVASVVFFRRTDPGRVASAEASSTASRPRQGR